MYFSSNNFLLFQMYRQLANSFLFFSSPALALCDWSSLQKTRRQVIRNFLLMKTHSKNHTNLDQTLMSEMDSLMAEVRILH